MLKALKLIFVWSNIVMLEWAWVIITLNGFFAVSYDSRLSGAMASFVNDC